MSEGSAPDLADVAGAAGAPDLADVADAATGEAGAVGILLPKRSAPDLEVVAGEERPSEESAAGASLLSSARTAGTVVSPEKRKEPSGGSAAGEMDVLSERSVPSEGSAAGASLLADVAGAATGEVGAVDILLSKRNAPDLEAVAWERPSEESAAGAGS